MKQKLLHDAAASVRELVEISIFHTEWVQYSAHFTDMNKSSYNFLCLLTLISEERWEKMPLELHQKSDDQHTLPISKWYIYGCCTNFFSSWLPWVHMVVNLSNEGNMVDSHLMWDKGKVPVMYIMKQTLKLPHFIRTASTPSVTDRLTVNQLRHAPLKHSDCK